MNTHGQTKELDKDLDNELDSELVSLLTEYLKYYDRPFSAFDTLKHNLFPYYSPSLKRASTPNKIILIGLIQQGVLFWSNLIQASKDKIEGTGLGHVYKFKEFNYYSVEVVLDAQFDIDISLVDFRYIMSTIKPQNAFCHKPMKPFHVFSPEHPFITPSLDMVSALEQLYYTNVYNHEGDF